MFGYFFVADEARLALWHPTVDVCRKLRCASKRSGNQNGGEACVGGSGLQGTFLHGSSTGKGFIPIRGNKFEPAETKQKGVGKPPRHAPTIKAALGARGRSGSCFLDHIYLVIGSALPRIPTIPEPAALKCADWTEQFIAQLDVPKTVKGAGVPRDVIRQVVGPSCMSWRKME